MSRPSIKSYSQDKTPSGYHYRSRFIIEDANNALVNSIRRACMSMVPTVAFDSTWHDDKHERSIVFDVNTSALHNEWLADRISLCPIRMTGNKELSIRSAWNSATHQRDFEFRNPELVPIFQIELKNDKTTSDRLDVNGYIKMTTDDFTVSSTSDGNKVVHRLHRFLPHDPFTDYPILLNKLKNNVNEDAGEEVRCICRPRVGTGRTHARHDPTGTVTYEFAVTKNEAEIRKVFRDRIEWINSEHKKVGDNGGKPLPPLTPDEIAAEEKSFNLLDRARVYERRPDGTAQAIKMSVESIGGLEPDQIVYDALTSLDLAIQDCLSCVSLTKEPRIGFTADTEKVEVTAIKGSAYGVYIHLKNEEHTLGNLIADYTKRLYAQGDGFGKELVLFSKVAYSMPHPLEKKVVIVYDYPTLSTEPSNPLPINLLLAKVINKYYSEVYGTPLDIKVNELSAMEYVQIVAVISFIRVCNMIRQDISRLLTEWSNHTKITGESFEVADEKEWLFRNVNNITLVPETVEAVYAEPATTAPATKKPAKPRTRKQ